MNNQWTIRGGGVYCPAPFSIFGIVNVTPDSFYDGGSHHGAADAVAHAKKLVADGAHVLDLGAESSRPFAPPVSQEEELARLLPVMEGLAEYAYKDGASHACATSETSSPCLCSAPLLSVDTYKAATAVAALEAGAHIINDISACAFDPALREVVAQYRAGYVLMHSQGKPETMQIAPRYDNVVEDILAFFECEMAKMVKAGLPEEYIVLDVGIGFGKTMEQNFAILQNIERFACLGRPLFMGLSNKSLFSDLLGVPKDGRQCATQVATALLAARGVAYHRVHDVAATAQTLKLVSAMQSVSSFDA